MHKFFISQYISKLTTDDVRAFALKNNINLSDYELNIIYLNIKNNWETLLYSDPSLLFNDLKTKLSPNNYESGILLYQYYHNLYKNYL